MIPPASSRRPWPFAGAAVTLALLANLFNADAMRALGVNRWFANVPYGWPLLLNVLDLLAIILALRLIAGVGLSRQWDIAGLARPLLPPAIFAAILFVPTYAALVALAGVDASLDPQELVFTGAVFPVFEEVVFRGLAIGVLMRHFGWRIVPAALLPSVFFGAAHLWQGGDLTEGLSIAALTGIGGLWFGWVYWKWGFNLWPAIFLHIGLNVAWTLFALGDNALGGQLGNIARVAVIAGSIALTLRGQGWIARLAGSRSAQPGKAEETGPAAP